MTPVPVVQTSVDQVATTFSKSLTLSEPEAEQSFNEASDDSYQSMNLMATAFVPTPKAGETRKSGASNQVQGHFFAPKKQVGYGPPTSTKNEANNYRSVPVPVKPSNSQL